MSPTTAITGSSLCCRASFGGASAQDTATRPKTTRIGASTRRIGFPFRAWMRAISPGPGRAVNRRSRLHLRARPLLVRVALLAPGVGVDVVPADLPEPALVALA